MASKGKTKAMTRAGFIIGSPVVKCLSSIISYLLPIRRKPFKFTLDNADEREYQKCLSRSKNESQSSKILISEGDFLEYTYWDGGSHILGYLNDYPDHWMQGRTQGELEHSLRCLYEDIDSELSASYHVELP